MLNRWGGGLWGSILGVFRSTPPPVVGGGGGMGYAYATSVEVIASLMPRASLT